MDIVHEVKYEVKLLLAVRVKYHDTPSSSPSNPSRNVPTSN
jgi:hypothetical protein